MLFQESYWAVDQSAISRNLSSFRLQVCVVASFAMVQGIISQLNRLFYFLLLHLLLIPPFSFYLSNVSNPLTLFDFPPVPTPFQIGRDRLRNNQIKTIKGRDEKIILQSQSLQDMFKTRMGKGQYIRQFAMVQGIIPQLNPLFHLLSLHLLFIPSLPFSLNLSNPTTLFDFPPVPISFWLGRHRLRNNWIKRIIQSSLPPFVVCIPHSILPPIRLPLLILLQLIVFFGQGMADFGITRLKP